VKNRHICYSTFLLGIVAILLASLFTGCGQPTPPTQSGAGLVEELTLDELAARADSILIGEVTDIACYQEINIYTLVTLSLEQTIKGENEGEEFIMVP